MVSWSVPGSGNSFAGCSDVNLISLMRRSRLHGTSPEVSGQTPPPYESTVFDTLAAASGATREPSLVPIRAMRTGEPVPDIYVEPPGADLGSSDLNRQDIQTLTLRNQGFASLGMTLIGLRVMTLRRLRWLG